MANWSKIRCSICRPYQIEIDYGQTLRFDKHNETSDQFKQCLLFIPPKTITHVQWPSCHMGEQLYRSSHHHSLAIFPKWFCQQSIALDKWASFFPQTDWVWCHLTFNNVVKMISNLTLPIVGESVIGWGIVSSIIPPPYPQLVLL